MQPRRGRGVGVCIPAIYRRDPLKRKEKRAAAGASEGQGGILRPVQPRAAAVFTLYIYRLYLQVETTSKLYLQIERHSKSNQQGFHLLILHRKKHSTASAFFVTGFRPAVIETPFAGVIGLMVAKNFEKI